MSPPSGTSPILVTLTGSAQMAAGAATFAHVNSANPLGKASINTGYTKDSTPPPWLRVNSTSSDQLIFDTVTQDSSDNNLQAGNLQTPVWNQPYYHGGSNQSAASIAPAGASGTTMNWSLAWGDWVEIGVPLLPALSSETFHGAPQRISEVLPEIGGHVGIDPDAKRNDMAEKNPERKTVLDIRCSLEAEEGEISSRGKEP